MTKVVSTVSTRVLLGLAAIAASVTASSAQTTVTLHQPKSPVFYATLLAGAYANTNFPTTLTTRAADTVDNHRRALLKFDTQNTIPSGTAITSAVMTLTVKSGSAAATRNIG